MSGKPGEFPPRRFTKYDADWQTLRLYWINPYDGKEESIGYFFWPGHPAEATEQVEAWFEEPTMAVSEHLALRASDAARIGELERNSQELAASTDKFFSDLESEREKVRKLREAIEKSIAIADDHGDSGTSMPIRKALKETECTS